jgi:hypothetical protein
MDRQEVVARAMCKADDKDPDQWVEMTYTSPGESRVLSRRHMRCWEAYKDKAWYVLAALKAFDAADAGDPA